MRRLAELAAAFGLLTRLPFGRLADDVDFAHAVWAYPVVGAVVGGLGGGVFYWLASIIGFTPTLAAGWTLAAMTLITGALHEDGLADTADGLGGGRTPARKLEIMRDSRIGSFGALALLLSLALRGIAIATLTTPGHVATALVVAGCFGRAGIIVVLCTTRPARPDGMAAALADIPTASVVIGCAVAGLIGFALLPWATALALLCLATITATGAACLAKRQIGGFTGDTLGATEVAIECLVLSALTL